LQKKSKSLERKKTPHAPPNIHHAHPHAHWNLSLTFFPFVPVPVLAVSKTTDLLKENFGNRKFRPGNHRSFKRKLWEQEIPARKPQIF
jgi:hypothetical protein